MRDAPKRHLGPQNAIFCAKKSLDFTPFDSSMVFLPFRHFSYLILRFLPVIR
jgi:hypothetical protein